MFSIYCNDSESRAVFEAVVMAAAVREFDLMAKITWDREPGDEIAWGSIRSGETKRLTAAQTRWLVREVEAADRALHMLRVVRATAAEAAAA